MSDRTLDIWRVWRPYVCAYAALVHRSAQNANYIQSNRSGKAFLPYGSVDAPSSETISYTLLCNLNITSYTTFQRNQVFDLDFKWRQPVVYRRST